MLRFVTKGRNAQFDTLITRSGVRIFAPPSGPNQTAVFQVPPYVATDIEYVGALYGQLTGAGATYTLNLAGTWAGGVDTALAEGDLVILLHGVANGSNLSHGISGSTGWTEGTEQYANGSSRDMNGRTAYKLMGSTPDTGVTVVAGSNGTFPCMAMAMAFRNVNQTTPLNVGFIMSQAGNSESMDPPALTLPTVDNCMVVCGAITTSASPPTDVTAPPSGFSNLVTDKRNGGAAISANIAMATKLQTTASTEDPSAFSGNTAAGVGGVVRFICAVNPV